MQPKNFLPLQQRTQRHIFTEITILIFKTIDFMTKKFLMRLLQASLMCCLAVLFTACDDMFATEDNPTSAYLGMSDKPVTIKVGETFQRQATSASTAVVEYTSSDTKIATVDNTGLVTAIAEGEATITATATGYSSQTGKKIYQPDSKSYVVTVVPATVPVTSITLNETNLNKKVGDAAVTLTATVAPDDATDKTVMWKSSDTNVATVDENGKVTFVGGGTATITATATNGTADTSDDKTATCAVTVALPPIPYKTYTWDGSTLSVPTDASATEYTKVTSSTVTWSDGTYVVDDNVTISGNIKVSGNVNLILCDGKTLTVNGEISGSSYGVGILSIYTQSVGTSAASFVATYNNGNAIYALNTLKIYGGDIQAKSSSSSCGGIVNTQIDVYGGKLTTKNTSSDGYGIYIGGGDNKSINLYGGELIAEGQGAINDYDYGIRLKHTSSCLTVYPGAKLQARNPTGDASHCAIKGKIKSGTSAVKFYFGDTSWDSGTSYASATEVGTDDATKKRYAKAE